jgi:hypothetical protein
VGKEEGKSRKGGEKQDVIIPRKLYDIVDIQKHIEELTDDGKNIIT